MVAMNNGTHNHRTWKEIIAAGPQHSRRYANRWRGFAPEGRDIDGEARLVDAMVPRHARILDAGCGQGRVGGYLARAGHQVVGVDVDAYLIDEAKRQFPDATWLVGDLAQLLHVLIDGLENSPHDDTAPAFDVIICPGNVLTFVAAEDRAKVLQGFAEVLVQEGGRAIIGFGAGRGWDFAEFETAAQGAGLAVVQRYSTWDLRAFDDESQFLVAVLEPA